MWNLLSRCCAIALLISGCSMSTGGRDRALERKLEGVVGKKYSTTEWNRPTGARTHQLPDSDGKRHYEYIWENGCTLVISVDAASDAIVHWHFAANPEACRSLRSYTFGT